MTGEGDRKVALFFYMKKSFIGQKTPDYLGYPKENFTFAVIQPNKSIMKKSLIALLSVWVAGSLNAQVLDGNKFGDNWSIGVNGGIVSPLTHSAFLKNARAVVGLDIDKQLSPIYGLTLESNWTVNTVSPMAWQYSHTAFDAFDVMLLNRVNLNRLFAGYKGKPSVFEVELMGGFGWLRLNNFYENGEGANHLASKAGVNFNFNMGEKKAWTIAIKPALFWDMSMWDAGRTHSHPNFNANYANWEITAGIAYHFKNSNGKHYMSKVRVYDAVEVASLNATINTLRQEVATKDDQLRRAGEALHKEEHKSADLARALDECRKREPKVITDHKKTLESVVTFRQGKVTIDASQQPNVERIATYLKNHKKAKVIILGYASPEGSAEVNARIAQQRAEAVRNMLVNKYRIEERRITAKGQGVGYMFEEPDWNRVSICTIVEN